MMTLIEAKVQPSTSSCFLHYMTELFYSKSYKKKEPSRGPENEALCAFAFCFQNFQSMR